MAIHLSAPRTTELKPRIVVFGVGGAGGNAVNNMIEAGLEGVEFVVANTDAQQLQFSKTERRVQLGQGVTQGLGAGAHPEVGMTAAEESFPEITEHLDGAHMVFITAGMGGGTGTGAAPVIARCARERGILTVGVVTKPFTFEGRHRMRLADAGISELQRYVDTLIVIPNQNLFRIANERTTFAEAFGLADQVLHSGVRSITDLMVLPGLINLDFADVRAVMSDMGKAMMGTGEASGEDRAIQAAQNAIANPLLDETSLKGAKAVLVNVTGGLDMTLLEVDEAANAISSEVDPDANIIFGAAFDPNLDGKLRVSVVATGMDNASINLAQSPSQSQSAPSYTPPSNPTTLRPGVQITPVAQKTTLITTPKTVLGAPRPSTAPSFDSGLSSENNAAQAPSPEPEPAPAPSQAETIETLTAESDMFSQAETPSRPEPVISYRQEREPVDFDIDSDPNPVVATRPPSQPVLEPVIEPASVTSSSHIGQSLPQDEPKGSIWSVFRTKHKQDQPIPDYAQPSQERPVQKQDSTLSARTNAQPAPNYEPAPAPEIEDDLEIPAFLRRLAN